MDTIVKDIVCGMDVSTDSEFYALQGLEKYYFCSEHCLHKFNADPKKYTDVKKYVEVQKSEERDVLYTCPMHPEVKQVGPGSCPKCGMALEPMNTIIDESENE